MVLEPKFRRFWKNIRLKIYLHSNVFSLMQMSLFYIFTRMDQSHDAVEEIVESANHMDLDPFVFGPSDLA